MKRTISIFISFALTLLLGLGLASALNVAQAANPPLFASNSCMPTIEFTAVPPYSSFANLHGRADCLDNPANYRIAAYIYVAGWWTKPYLDAPLTIIQPDGAWTTDITTGGTDEEATKIAAFLVPTGYSPPLMNGNAPLPTDLFANALDYVHVERTRRELEFDGRTWHVKHTAYLEGPGPNYYSDDPQDVWVDGAGRLHLRLAHRDGAWYSSEVFTAEPMGYGLYTFHLSGPIDQLNENVVLGLFTWDSVAPPDAYSREVDIEFSRWGDPASADNAQYVLQPWDQPGNLHRFSVTLPTTDSLHLFDWQPGYVRFASYQGSQPTPGNMLHSWLYTGTDVPEADDGNGRINLWQFNGVPPSDGQEAEIVVESFTFTPRETTIHVAPSGSDEVGCGSTVWPCATIPYALSLAQTDDNIQVAEGTYAGTVVLTKSVQLLGGYDPLDWTRDITNNVTLLNGLDAGPTIQVTSGSTATVEGFHITNGQATNGGGVYVSAAAPTIAHNWLYANTAASNGGGFYLTNNAGGLITGNDIYQNQALRGGGIYVGSGVTAVITDNAIHNHITSAGGAGVYIAQGTPVIQGNDITNNEVTNYFHGGGLYLAAGTPTVISNTIAYNESFGWGGGIYVAGGTPTITYNDIHHNVAGNSGYTSPDGGGIHIEVASGGLVGFNHIHHNTAYDDGGGLFLKSNTAVTDNLFEYNSATDGGGISVWGNSVTGSISRNVIQFNNGEGIHLWFYAHPTISFNRITNQNDSGIAVLDFAYPTLDGNVIMNNTAVTGGGLRIQSSGTTIVRNNAILNNVATVSGSGVYIATSGPQFRHNTISGNSGGGGAGIYVAAGTVSTVFNNIIAYQTVGVFAGGSSNVTVNGILWHNNSANTGGTGTVSVSNAYEGDPTFAADGYHLLPGSPAINVGINAGVISDIDEDTRPIGPAPDLGADEVAVPPASVTVTGPTAGEVGQSYSFMGTVLPDNTTTPLTYEWLATGHSPILHTGGLVDTAVFTWNEPGIKQITVTASNSGGTVTATHTITITTANQPPTAVDDTAVTDEDTAVTIPLLANDSDPDGDPLTITAVGSPQHGTASSNGLAAVYTPTLNFFGQDVFTYTVTDGEWLATAVVTVTVLPVNDAPVAADDTAETPEDKPRTIAVLGNDSDVDGDALLVSDIGNPSHGTAVTDGTWVTYTPTTDFNGQDVFTYTISDGQLTDTAVVTVTVGAVNDAPVAVDDVAETDEDTAVTIPVLANDNDPDGDTLAMSAVGAAQHGEVSLVGTAVRYTPTLNFHGTDTFTYTISDGELVATAAVTITIRPVNDAPIAADDTAETDAGTAVSIPVLDNDSDPDGDELTVTAAGPAGNGEVSIVGTAVVYTPSLDFTGTETFTYIVSDGSLAVTALVTVTVHPATTLQTIFLPVIIKHP